MASVIPYVSAWSQHSSMQSESLPCERSYSPAPVGRFPRAVTSVNSGLRLRVRRPSLPRWLNRVEVSGLRIAGSRVDLLFERAGDGEQVALTDARIDGDVEVVLEIAGTRGPRGARG